MLKLCVNAVLVDDCDGGQHAVHIMAYAPCQDGVVDTSSGALKRTVVFYDDCLGTVHARSLWNNKTCVIHMGLLNVFSAMSDLLDTELNQN
jgi:hypothetical protein